MAYNVQKVRDLVIKAGERYSDILTTANDISDAETLLIISDPNTDNVTGNIQIAGDTKATSDSQWADLYDDNNNLVTVPPANGARRYDKPTWPSARISLDVVATVDLTFGVYKIWRM